jgi:hypothetical protein
VFNAMRNAYASHTDFGFLNGIIQDNPKAMPSNLDMVLERKGKFLVGEWKRTNEEISVGQKILLKQLAILPNFTVLIINGYSDNEGIEIDKFYQVGQSSLIYIDTGIDALKSYINTWYKLSNNGI